MQKTLLIMGAGGHGKAVADAALLGGQWQKIVFVDDRWPGMSSAAGWPVIAAMSGIGQVVQHADAGVVAIGNNAIRERWSEALRETGISLAVVIHPSAVISSGATIGMGSTVMAQTMIGVDAVLGEGCIINAGATVDHDGVLGDFAHLGVGVHLSGGVRVGARAWLQAGCCIGYNTVVPDGSVHTPGSILVQESFD